MRDAANEVFVHVACSLGKLLEDAAHLDQLQRVHVFKSRRDKWRLRR